MQKTIITSLLLFFCVSMQAQNTEKEMPEYLEGMKSLDDKDYTAAEIWFSKAANKGNSQAMFELYNLYYTCNRAKGNKFLWKAAKKENIDAMLLLGWMYYMKDCNFKQSLKWYAKAANKGSIEAMLEIGNYLYNSVLPPLRKYKNLAKAREWYEKAAEMGSSEAKARLDELKK